MPSTAVLRDVASASPTDPKTYEDALATKCGSRGSVEFTQKGAPTDPRKVSGLFLNCH
ncbi:hypothetical protein RR48_12165 [Papilio machaon]|uniref:Uncharacterized protein n=1 Tax=Papilio machaon TaxID=76193 RepID=A0A194QSE9_PAPMA|nr:hypothetical protein RR48_12165 [Papilio machaon]